MRIVYFTHSLASCWNHGNAHFLRGVLRELIRHGHDVRVFEPRGAWSLQNLLADHGEAGLDAYRAAYPELASTEFDPGLDLEWALDGADLVVVHEWNEPALVAAIGAVRSRGGRFTLLFHDTHHRAVSDPEAIRAFDLSGYDGVLAFGEALSEVYRRWGWSGRVFTWHEAADTALFHPPAQEAPREGLVWIGNWGDGERTAELERFLMAPARVGCPTPARRRCSRAVWRRCTCPGASMWRCCPASRRSGSSRPWPAASRWSRPPGRIARACSVPERTSSPPATGTR
jgi:spore maturation protein CgeB